MKSRVVYTKLSLFAVYCLMTNTLGVHSGLMYMYRAAVMYILPCCRVVHGIISKVVYCYNRFYIYSCYTLCIV